MAFGGETHSIQSSPQASLPRHGATAQATGSRDGWWLLALGLLAALWDLSGWDRTLAQAVGGGAHGFPLRDHWLLTAVLHDAARKLSWALALALCIGVLKPFGPLKLLDLAARARLAAGLLAAVIVVVLLKGISPAACPWDLADYGGHAPAISHWAWFHRSPGVGHCFPAGHASSGFAFLAGWVVFRPVHSRLAHGWLWAALLAGSVMGLAQQWRGAHFMSHTLWTVWLCLATVVLVDRLGLRLQARQASA